MGGRKHRRRANKKGHVLFGPYGEASGPVGQGLKPKEEPQGQHQDQEGRGGLEYVRSNPVPPQQQGKDRRQTIEESAKAKPMM